MALYDGSSSTIIATELPVDAWYAHIGEPTIADDELDLGQPG